MRIYSTKKAHRLNRKYIKAAEDFRGLADFGNEDENMPEMTEEDLDDEEMSKDEINEEFVEDVETSPVTIEVDNNIENHYIAECGLCHTIFISAVLASDSAVDHITGICPVCEQESDQYLKWVIRPVDEVVTE